jgi:5-methylcytosine-specific restriction endonuclease McrA
MKSSANSINSIENRMRIVLYDFYDRFNSFSIIKLDEKRIFDDIQKLEIYSKNKGICQLCSKKVAEFNWHADHITPWIKGGRTVVENGQTLCVKCNIFKKDKII